MEDYGIRFDQFFEVDGWTFACVLSWDFDNWTLDGFFKVKGSIDYNQFEELYNEESPLVVECSDDELNLLYRGE